jgi:hypothetical protein
VVAHWSLNRCNSFHYYSGSSAQYDLLRAGFVLTCLRKTEEGPLGRHLAVVQQLTLRRRPCSSLRLSGPNGHGSPGPVLLSTCDGRAAAWARCYELPPVKLTLSTLAPRAPDAREPILLFVSAAWPDWPQLAKYRDFIIAGWPVFAPRARPAAAG